ncbi:hypothetical protein FA13DRAFT_1742665 [Coprinellus micaceus]|uniref:Uncharacterized protein n=1 Tax=Coprinellus micaceus TaxID=71717 RepID=A0A4Y7SGC3_COPMI|nr:hypothetical protein FA13DRAFT_1742665 [Coprinellus micaceus]
MALPSSITTKNLSGRFTLNKTLSDTNAFDAILIHESIGWIKRKAFAIGTVTLTFKHYTDKDGVEHFDIDNHLTGGIPGTQERRPVDSVERERSDMHFGPQLFYTKRRAPNDVEGLSEFLKGNWTEDTLENGLLETDVKSDTAKSRTSWLERHVWGIEEVQGERRFTRHIEFEGPKGQRLDTIMYFDYLGA